MVSLLKLMMRSLEVKTEMVSLYFASLNSSPTNGQRQILIVLACEPIWLQRGRMWDKSKLISWFHYLLVTSLHWASVSSSVFTNGDQNIGLNSVVSTEGNNVCKHDQHMLVIRKCSSQRKSTQYQHLFGLRNQGLFNLFTCSTPTHW